MEKAIRDNGDGTTSLVHMGTGDALTARTVASNTALSDAVDLLNCISKTDNRAINALFKVKVACSSNVAWFCGVPMTVDANGQAVVSVIDIMNAVLSCRHGDSKPIEIERNPSGRIIGFKLSERGGS